MSLDDLEQLAIADRPGKLDDGIGRGLREPGPLREAAMLVGVDELEHVDARVQLVRRLDLRHLGVDELHALLPRQRDPMVPIGDEVESAGLVDRDRRHRPVLEGIAEGAQTSLQLAPAGAEEPIEVDRAVNRPDDGVGRDLAHADVMFAENAQVSLDIPQRQQRLVSHRR